MVLKNILETLAYKTNSDNMTIPYLKALTSGYEKHPENKDGKINEQVLRLLEIIEAVKQTPSSICAPTQGATKLEKKFLSVVGFIE